MSTLRRLPITLLEILLVMAILGLVAGIVGISINKTLVDQRFRTEVSRITDELRLAQDLMLILGIDIHVKFAEKEDNTGINYWLEMETTLPDNLVKEVLRKHQVLKTIRGVFFEDELIHKEEHGQIDIKFLSNGAVMSKGILLLSTADQEHSAAKGILQNYICLTGFPSPIQSFETKELAAAACLNFIDSDFDEKLSQDTIQKFGDNLKKNQEPEEGGKASQSASKKTEGQKGKNQNFQGHEL